MTGAFPAGAAKHGLGRALRRRRRLREGLVQLVYILAGAALALLIPRIPVGFTVPSDETKTALLSIGAAIVPFIGIVFSLLFLVVQFGSTTFTPRLNLFRRAPIVWHAFSYFSAVFVFSFMAAFTIPKNAAVSGLVPIVTGAAVLAAFAVFRTLQFAAFDSIQLAPSLAQVTVAGHDLIDGIYPADLRAGPPPAATGRPPGAPAERHELLWPYGPAVLQFIDVPRLLRAAEGADIVIELCAATGETLQRHDCVAVVHGTGPAALDADILKALGTGVERTFEQDPGLALRVLADIALRALSPAVNDPTSAAQALDGLDSLLRALVTRDLDAARTPGTGHRLIMALPGWDDYLGTALDETISSAAGSIQVRRRIERLLGNLARIAPAQRLPAIQTRLEGVRASVPRPLAQ